MRDILPVLCFTLFAISGCKKEMSPDPVAPSDPYVYSADLQNSKDISFAFYAVSDIEMICAFLGQIQNPVFYLKNPSASPTNTDVVIYDTLNESFAMSFMQTSCRDNYLRDGTVFLVSNNQSGNGKYYVDFGYTGKFYLASYSVSNWRIEAFVNNGSAFIKNDVDSPSYDPSQTNLRWHINGKFKFTNLNDTTKTIVWDGTFIKTLLNTNDSGVFHPSKTKAINWKLAKVNYTGSATGLINGTIPFSYIIDNSNAIKRDFTCSFQTLLPGATEFHPFTGGSATFNFSNYHPRVIDYGPSQSCDNTGTISFHGETHTVNFD